jgi:hypothetical protein
LRNPRKVVCTAICAVLEIVWCLRQRKVPISYVPNIQEACNNALAKLTGLFMTKQALLGKAGVEKIPVFKKPAYGMSASK